MNDEIPTNTRPVARVLLMGPGQRPLLLLARDSGGHEWWVTPGGALESGESFEQAAQRELREETGLHAPIGPWAWTRRHAYQINDRWYDQYERFFVATTAELQISPIKQDSYIHRHRWWTLPELAAAADVFAPRRLPDLIGPIARGEYPDAPFDCGV